MPALSARRWIALLATGAISLAACSTASSKNVNSSPSGTGGTQSTALGKGVTANTIKIGFSYIDLETLAKSGIIKIDNGPYEQVIKASHNFNMLDARGVISVTERQSYILRVRELAKACGEAWLATEGGGAA